MSDTGPLPEKVRSLNVSVGGVGSGQLLRHSVYEYRYATPEADQPSVALQMPARQPTWQAGDLFPSMDQNLPEGDLFMRLRAMFPKQSLTPMHLLALGGQNGIGRLGFTLQNRPAPGAGRVIDKATLLATRYSPSVFDELVAAYLSTGAGIAGMQPKIMVPDRPTVPVPSLIVKAASETYPGLAANEFLCLSAAKRAGILTPTFALSDDGQMLVLDRFDLVDAGEGKTRRLGFEDVAALGGLRVRDTLADRKYHGSYQQVAELLRKFMLHSDDLHRFFEQVAFSVMVRNGDAHLKNFGLLYSSEKDLRLAPMFDVVTTAVYRYTQYAGGPELEDRTLALKLFSGKHGSKVYPTTEALLDFGRRVCGVQQPQRVIGRIAQAMAETLESTRGDARVPGTLRNDMRVLWEDGMAHDRVAANPG